MTRERNNHTVVITKTVRLIRWCIITVGSALLIGSCSSGTQNDGDNSGIRTLSACPTERTVAYAAAAERLHNASRMSLEGISIPSGSRELSRDEMLAIRWLVSKEHLVSSEPGTGHVAVSTAITHFILVGDDRWSVFRDGLFPETGSRLCRYAHPELDFNTPDGRDGEPGSKHVEQGIERLVSIWRSETQKSNENS